MSTTTTITTVAAQPTTEVLKALYDAIGSIVNPIVPTVVSAPTPDEIEPVYHDMHISPGSPIVITLDAKKGFPEERIELPLKANNYILCAIPHGTIFVDDDGVQMMIHIPSNGLTIETTTEQAKEYIDSMTKSKDKKKIGKIAFFGEQTYDFVRDDMSYYIPARNGSICPTENTKFCIKKGTTVFVIIHNRIHHKWTLEEDIDATLA